MNAHDDWTLQGLGDRVPADLRAWMPAGSDLVVTPAIQRAVLLTPPLVAQGRIGLVDGPTGVGKSQLLGAVQAACPHRVVRIQLERRDHGKRLDSLIYTELTGQIAAGTESDIERANTVEICRTPTLLIVDEAQLVPASTLLSLRRMLRDAGRPFGLLFAGVGMVEHAKRDVSLGSRPSFVITLRPLTGDQLVPALAAFHPLLAAAEPGVLGAADHVRCRGQWRAWMLLLEAHQNLHGADAAITRDTMASTLQINYELSLPAPNSATSRRSRRGAA
jgi:energy-coupling factor transporter ATP-binding protein EcfA2